MSIRLLSTTVFTAIGLAVLLTALPPATHGCAIAFRPDKPVSIVGEDAIVVWDAVKKVEHFIRRASFRTESRDFGFLVPTPGVPTLSEVDDDVFDHLSQMIRPKVREVFGGVEYTTSFACSATKKSMIEAKSVVTVLSEAKVGGYQAAVLQADDAKALDNWLQANGYPGNAELYGWLGPYLVEKWTITAFKIDAGAQPNRRGVRSKAAKMSFATDRPFFPYREPANSEPAIPTPRSLRVFLLANERMSGTLGNIPWHAKTVWADRVADAKPAEMVTIPATDMPTPMWLTAFEDTASPRPATAEVFFDASKDQSVVHPADILHQMPPFRVPVELAFLGAVCVAVVGWAAVTEIRRRSRSSTPSQSE
jgi:Uncharacterized protein conserved in bacteria (DUF2330)